MPNFTNDEVNHKFEGVVSDLTDILPCPLCKCLKSKSANNIHLPPYQTRYQCLKCGTFYRFDHTPPELQHEEIMMQQEMKERNSKLILP